MGLPSSSASSSPMPNTLCWCTAQPGANLDSMLNGCYQIGEATSEHDDAVAGHNTSMATGCSQHATCPYPLGCWLQPLAQLQQPGYHPFSWQLHARWTGQPRRLTSGTPVLRRFPGNASAPPRLRLTAVTVLWPPADSLLPATGVLPCGVLSPPPTEHAPPPRFGLCHHIPAAQPAHRIKRGARTLAATPHATGGAMKGWAHGCRPNTRTPHHRRAITPSHARTPRAHNVSAPAGTTHNARNGHPPTTLPRRPHRRHTRGRTRHRRWPRLPPGQHTAPWSHP